MSEKEKRDSTNPDPVFAMHMQAMRELAEPRDGISPTPVSYIIICFFYVMWGGWYIGNYAGDWTGNGLTERASSGPAVAGPAQDPMVLGKEVYGSCIQCHQENGLGVVGTTPPLAGSEYVLGDKRRMTAILLNGLNGELMVKGQLYNSQMPAWNVRDDEELAAVMTYVRASWGNKADRITKEFVTAVRKEIDGKGEWRANTLAEFTASTPSAAVTAALAPAPAVATPPADAKK